MWRHPFEAWTLTFLSYSEVYFLTIAWNILLVNLLVMLLFIILYISKKHLIDRSKKQYLSMITQQSKRQDEDHSQIHQRNNQLKAKKLSIMVLDLSISFLYYSFWVISSSFYLIYYCLGKLGHGLFYQILAIVVMLFIIIIPTIIWKTKNSLKAISQMKKQYIFTAIACFLWLIIVIVLTIQGQGVCLCSYNDNYGTLVEQGFVLSTKKSRQRTIKKVCQNGQICHLYATLPQKTYQEVFINVHTGVDIKNLTIIFINTKTGSQIPASAIDVIQFIWVEQIGQRNIHSVFFEKLQSSTLYEVSIYNTLTKQILKNTTYKTPPSPTDNATIKLGVGGDVGLTKNGTSLTKLLIQYEPDVIIVGGDTAYDDAMQTCYYSWDNFYWSFQNIQFQLKRVIPLILTIGNHDVGFNALASKQIEKSNSQVPFYYLYNPQHRALQQNKLIPQLAQRSSHHYHIIGKTLHFHLDSGYQKSYEQQAQQIDSISQKYPSFYKFANYHNPIFPLCADFSQGSNDMQVNKLGIEYWLPKFDKQNFIAVFQHHTHQRKFSYKIKGGVINENGTRFLGEGSWGIPESSCSKSYIKIDKSLFQHYQVKDANHIWQVTIHENNSQLNINYTALNIYGKQVFQKVQSLSTLS